MSDSPAVVLYDAAGVAMAVSNGIAIPVGTKVLLVAGSDGTNARTVKVSAVGRVVTDGSEVTSPISAASLPLPTGAATDAGLVALLAELQLKADLSETQPVSAASLPLPAGAATQATLATLLTQATGAAIQAVLEAIRDTAGIKKITDQLPAGTNRLGAVRNVDANDVALDLARDIAIPAGSRGLLSVGQATDGKAQAIQVEVDAVDSKRRVQMEGRVSITAPTPPASTTAVAIDASSPLAISSDHTTTYTIPATKTFYLQQLVAGSEGDSTEKGSGVEVIYYDGATEHLVERFYLNGFTVSASFNDLCKARDGTVMEGNGTTKTIRVKRRRLSGSAQEVDVEVRGYVV